MSNQPEDPAARAARVRAELDTQNRRLAEAMANTDHNGNPRPKEDPK